ncbi:hypothetical protein PN36_19750 [Candidatus Thiomargarita nelsonii]|uniref:PilZ domain-containing protein n=1 Tax=Candidatus Thiomargarita nelsonii TaxID=1003181 RepID=A0A0A6RXF0_9GAMM|nr:hypothetical protein PN36_19750 [Candidatus Thiomargarita nelsonii]
MIKQKRESRYQLSNSAPENVEVYEDGEHVGHLDNISVSGEGLMFFSKYPYKNGSYLALEVELPNTTLSINGEVRWYQAELSSVGLQLKQSSSTTQLSRYCHGKMMARPR